MGSNHAGNGLEGTKRSDLGNGEQEKDPLTGAQPQNDEENEGRKHSVGGIISGRTLSDRSGLDLSNKNNEDLDILISKYKGQKLTNEQVAEVVSAACFVSGITKFLNENLNLTDDLKDICNSSKVAEQQKKAEGF
jgi:hypothetical protein